MYVTFFMMWHTSLFAFFRSNCSITPSGHFWDLLIYCNKFFEKSSMISFLFIYLFLIKLSKKSFSFSFHYLHTILICPINDQTEWTAEEKWSGHSWNIRPHHLSKCGKPSHNKQGKKNAIVWWPGTFGTNVSGQIELSGVPFFNFIFFLFFDSFTFDHLSVITFNHYYRVFTKDSQRP